MSEEVARAASDLNYWRNRAEQAEALALTLQAQRDQAEADAAALRFGLDEITRQPVGAYETSSGSIEPCDACGETRTIADNALNAHKAGIALLAENAALRDLLWTRPDYTGRRGCRLCERGAPNHESWCPLATDHPGDALFKELTLLRELAADLARWRESSDARDLRYVLETADRHDAAVKARSE